MRRGGEVGTGIALLLDYDLWSAPTTRSDHPTLLAFEVDRAVDLHGDDVRFIGCTEDDERRWRAAFQGAPRFDPARIVGTPKTSLPRERYLTAVQQVREAIGEGEVYQANLCQRFDAPYTGDPLTFFDRLAESSPAPRASYLAYDRFALASLSPETFVVSDGSMIETLPIKGTRARSANKEQDAAIAQELLQSEKDRAELLMIVDLERNDLGRICEVGSIHVPELIEVRPYPKVHHLVSRVRGTLDPAWTIDRLVRAIFPGGSITGAPKIAAMRLLEQLEPVRRGWFTGSLIWFGDDGSIDSSILIRSVVFDGTNASIGAGGGVVIDSDPEAEWRESNHKARFLTQALGFEPEEAT